jgi:hypothetical protein
MSRFKDKASAVYEQGVAERGNFTPSGAPLRIYKNWAARTGSAPAKENFCHFWRVVAIWAPLAWFSEKGQALVNKTAVQVSAGIVLLAAVVWACFQFTSVFQGVAVVLGTVFALCALLAGVVISAETFIPDEGEWDAPWQKYLTYALAVVGLPFALVGFTVASIGFNWKQSWNKPILNVLGGFAFLVGVGGIVALVVSAFMSLGWILLAYIAGVAVAIVGVGAALTGIVTFIEGKRALAKAAKKAARDKRYDDWLHDRITDDEYYGRTAHSPSKFELKVAAFFTAIADFLVLAFQVVRVNKWKICPIVEVK